MPKLDTIRLVVMAVRKNMYKRFKKVFQQALDDPKVMELIKLGVSAHRHGLSRFKAMATRFKIAKSEVYTKFCVEFAGVLENLTDVTIKSIDGTFTNVPKYICDTPESSKKFFKDVARVYEWKCEELTLEEISQNFCVPKKGSDVMVKMTSTNLSPQAVIFIRSYFYNKHSVCFDFVDGVNKGNLVNYDEEKYPNFK